MEAGTEVKVDDYRSYFSVWYPTVTFDGGGAESGSMDSVEVRNNDGMYTLPECGFTKSGYVFSGWKDSNGQGVLFPGYETYVSQPVTYVAVWQPPITVGEVSVKSPSVINGTIEGWSPDMDGIALKIKNETDKVLTLTTELAVLGESGGKQEASSDYISAVGPGETVLVSATVLDENKKGKQTAYTIEATDEFSSLFTPISGMIKQEIIDQKNDELTLKISNTSNRDIYISGVGLIAKDKSGTTLIGNGYYYVELKPGESGDVTFRDTNLLGGGQIHADWSSLTCEFYIEGYSNNF